MAIDGDTNRTSAITEGTRRSQERKGKGLNAQDRWGTDGGNGSEDGRSIPNSHVRQRDPVSRCGRGCPDATGDDDRTNRKCDSDAESEDNNVSLCIVAVLQRLIPAVEHLDDGRAKRDGDDDRDAESPNH
jgi:hypothetical protein